MKEDPAEIQRLPAKIDQSLKHGKCREAINQLRRMVSIASTMALTLELRTWRKVSTDTKLNPLRKRRPRSPRFARRCPAADRGTRLGLQSGMPAGSNRGSV
jgi:hypothetical protein